MVGKLCKVNRPEFCQKFRKVVVKKYIFAGCSTINVNLRNEVLNTYAILNGNYQSATNVNGKPSWKNDLYAIWYSQSNNIWLIGPLSEIGSDSAWIFASNNFSGITDHDNHWLYWNFYFQAWTSPSEPNDIQIACMNGNY